MSASAELLAESFAPVLRRPTHEITSRLAELRNAQSVQKVSPKSVYVEIRDFDDAEVMRAPLEIWNQTPYPVRKISSVTKIAFLNKRLARD